MFEFLVPLAQRRRSGLFGVVGVSENGNKFFFL